VANKVGRYLDYADQRYYASLYGRFATADPAKSVNPKDPVSWNRYAYVGGDPVSRRDRRGLCWIDGNTGDEFEDEDWEFEVYIGAVDQGNYYHSDGDCQPNVVSNDPAAGGGPAAATSGGGGGWNGPTVSSTSSFEQLQSQATAALTYELANLTPNCDKVLPVGDLKSLESFEPLTFWNATTQGNTPALLLGGTNGGTIGSYFANGQYAVILNGAGGSFINQVVLGANFFSDSGAQGLTLLHELLHFDLQMGDQAIDAHFNINVGVAGYSAAFSSWLANDCNN
jgi:RHS repeat-associated protein